MTERRIVTVDGSPYHVTISDEEEALLAAYAAGGAVIGIWDRRRPDQCLSPAEYVVESTEDIDEELLERVVRRRIGLPWVITRTERLVIREFTPEDSRFMKQWQEENDPEDESSHIFEQEDTLRAYIQCQYRFYEYGIWALEERATGRIIGRAGLFLPVSREVTGGEEGCESGVVADRNGNMSGSDGESGKASEEAGSENDKEKDTPLELGYHIFSPFRQKGYGREACAAILEYAVQTGTRTVMAVIASDNIPSIRLAHSLGFQCVTPECSATAGEKCQYVWSCS